MSLAQFGQRRDELRRRERGRRTDPDLAGDRLAGSCGDRPTTRARWRRQPPDFDR